VEVRVIAATNRDLAQRVREGRFRGDLFHRISVFSLEMPPLRDRLDDLEDLVPLFIAEFNAKAGKTVRIVPESVWARLRSHNWPGNVRELRNVVERCVLLSEDEVFPAHWLQLQAEGLAPPLDRSARESGLWLPLDGSVSLDDMECYIIQNALERANCNVTAAARLLGTTRQTLRYRVQKYNLKCDH
jgi:transcriptional regulator with GAF, ATPase, and Fis domain